MAGSIEDERLAVARSLLRSGHKIFLRHDHSPGYLHEKAQWSGEYHLAHVEKSWDAETNKFEVLWLRNDKVSKMACVLRSHSQVMSAANYASMMVQVECDVNGNMHTAKIVDLLEGSDGRPGEVVIKWDQGHEEVVNVSQVAFGCRRRKRRATKQMSPADWKSRSGKTDQTNQGSKLVEDMATNQLSAAGGSSRSQMNARKRNDDRGKSKKVSKPVEVILIDSSSSEDEGNGNQPPAAEEDDDHASPDASSSSSVESMTSKIVTRIQRSQKEGDEGNLDADNGSRAGNTPNNCFDIPTATGRLFSEDDLHSYRVNYERSGDSDDNVVMPSSGDDRGVVSKRNSPTTSPPSATGDSPHSDKSEGGTTRKIGGAKTQEKNAANSLLSSQRSDAEEAASTPIEGPLTQEHVNGESPKAAASSLVKWMVASSSQDSEASYIPSSSSSDDSESVLYQGVTTPESDSISSFHSRKSDEGEMMAVTLSRAERRRKMITARKDTSVFPGSPKMSRRKRARAATPQKGTAVSSLPLDKDEERAAFPKRSGRYDSAKTVTPQKKSGETQAPSFASPRGSGILMHGFCQSIPQMKTDPRRSIEMIQNMLDKAKDCKGDSEEVTELRETLVDANMLLQEMLFNLEDRTTFVKATSSNNSLMPISPKNSDGNKRHIVQLAKQFGLVQDEIDDILAHLTAKDGYFSIHDAIPEIIKLKKTDSSPKADGNGDSREAAAENENEGKGRNLQLLGSRVRTVFEDGNEHEGTISTIHYRVTYDDGDTETFVSEAEAYENLACNDSYLNNARLPCGEDIRCSMLEIFSGCSLLSTHCKRRGMNVKSIDNDMDSNATIKSDFTSGYVQSMLASETFDYIHASPVCSTYSLLAGGKHRKSHNYNCTPESHEADAMLMMLYFCIVEAIGKNKNITITIENPKAWMRKGNIMKELFEGELGFKAYEINYCQFGRGDKKPTNIWTNDAKLGNMLEKIGGKCNCRLPHEEGVRKSGHTSNFAALPFKLCEIISSYIHSKHTQLKFEKYATTDNSCAGD